MQPLIRILAVVVLMAVIGYALTITGSPTHTRQVNEDIDTLEALDVVHNSLSAHYYIYNRLPGTLPDINALKELRTQAQAEGLSNCRRYYDVYRIDDAQISRFEYTPTTAGYKICAPFHTSWHDVTLNQGFYGERYDWAKDFQQGRHCFERTIPACKKRN
jgi:hypothetical protein